MNGLMIYAKLRHGLACFAKNDQGATAIEYALIAAGIAMTIIVAVNTLGTDTILPMFESFATLF